jgi:hypothetical protein
MSEHYVDGEYVMYEPSCWSLLEGRAGLYGSLIIKRRPAEIYAYTNDFSFIVADYYNDNAHSLLTRYYLTPVSEGREPIPDAIIVNGHFTGTLTIPVSRSDVSRSLRIYFECFPPCIVL